MAVSTVFLVSCLVLYTVCDQVQGASLKYSSKNIDTDVLYALDDFSKQLGRSSSRAFRKYDAAYFPGNGNKPLLNLNLMQYPFTKQDKTAEDVLKNICNMTYAFRTPVFLAWYDEKARSGRVATALYRVSSAVNTTYETARYLFGLKFPKSTLPTVKHMTRKDLDATVVLYKALSKDQSGVNDLRTWSTLDELANFMVNELVNKVYKLKSLMINM